jgi:hypothetical protein
MRCLPRSMRLLLCLALCARAGDAEPANGRGPEAAHRSFFVEVAAGYSKGQLFSHSLVPRSFASPIGGGGALSAGVLWKTLGFGPRVWGWIYDRGMTSYGIAGEVTWRLFESARARVTAHLSAGYGGVNSINLERAGLRTYDAGGFDLGIGPTIAWLPLEGFALGLGARSEWLFVSRPVLGPCDDAHGCDGVFYPNESAGGLVSFFGAELSAAYDF